MPCGGGAFQEFFGILAAGKVSYLLHYIPLLLDILDGSELLQKGQNSKLAPFSRWFCVCQHLQGHSWLFHGFSTLFQVSSGFAGGVWGIPEIPGVFSGEKVGEVASRGLWSWKKLDFPGIIALPWTQPHSTISDFPTPKFLTDFSLLGTEQELFHIPVNSSSSPRSLVGNDELQGPGNSARMGRGSSFHGFSPAPSPGSIPSELWRIWDLMGVLFPFDIQ